MNWTIALTSSVGATAGTMLAYSYFIGFDLVLTLALALSSFLGALVLGYAVGRGRQRE